MSEGKGKKRSKAFYRKSAHGGKRHKSDANILVPGIRGFLVMCNHNESSAVRESYNILNDYADKIYGQGNSKSTGDGPSVSQVQQGNSSDEDSDEDVEKALRKEVQDMKTVPSEERRFQNCLTKAKNCVFIRSTVEDPVKVCQFVMEDIAEKKVLRARYAARILPVVGTCKAHTSDIKQLAQDCLTSVFSPASPDTPPSFTLIFKARNNNTKTCGKTSVIPALTRVVKEINPEVQFSWSDFEVAVLVEIVGKVCCLAVAPGFIRLRKYNLQELQQGPRLPSEAADKNSAEDITSTKTDNISVGFLFEDSSKTDHTADENRDTKRDASSNDGKEGSLVSESENKETVENNERTENVSGIGVDDTNDDKQEDVREECEGSNIIKHDVNDETKENCPVINEESKVEDVNCTHDVSDQPIHQAPSMPKEECKKMNVESISVKDSEAKIETSDEVKENQA